MRLALDRWRGLDQRLAYAKVAALIDRQPNRESVVSVEIATMDGSTYGLRDCVLQIAGVGLVNGQFREVCGVCFDLACGETRLLDPRIM